MKCRMAENQELRKKMEDYVKQHDLTRLFERLATSIMYDRPDELNKYAADWLTKIKNARSQLGEVPSSFSLEGSGSASVKSSTSLPGTRDSVLTQDSYGSHRSKTSKNSRDFGDGDLQPEGLIIPEGGGEGLDRVPDFDPYIFSPENIPIFYGMLDPLDEGSISVQHFREVCMLLDLERHIDWNSLGENVRRDEFCDLLIQAFKNDVEDLQRHSGELPEEIMTEEESPKEELIGPEVPDGSYDMDIPEHDRHGGPEFEGENQGENEAEVRPTGSTTSAASLAKSSEGSIGSRTSVPSKTTSSGLKLDSSAVEEAESEEEAQLTAKLS